MLVQDCQFCGGRNFSAYSTKKWSHHYANLLPKFCRTKNIHVTTRKHSSNECLLRERVELACWQTCGRSPSSSISFNMPGTNFFSKFLSILSPPPPPPPPPPTHPTTCFSSDFAIIRKRSWQKLGGKGRGGRNLADATACSVNDMHQNRRAFILLARIGYIALRKTADSYMVTPSRGTARNRMLGRLCTE